jgi:hypothetical protein
MNQPTHEEIAAKAHTLWKDRGCPEGIDNEIWLEAEKQLRAGEPPGRESRDAFTRRATAEAAAESRDEFHLSPAASEQQAIRAALQKQDARAPQVPHHTGPKGKPAETGKPLWDKPHSA